MTESKWRTIAGDNNFDMAVLYGILTESCAEEPEAIDREGTVIKETPPTING